ncbi:MAG TPA: hypothetical protein DD383_04050 [Rikenellaceae bacterium]|nr:hypothetical protein [Rikenellaceae bacterium]
MVKKKNRIGSSSFLYGILAAVLLLCLFDMPYGFYTFVRFLASVSFCYLAFKACSEGNNDRMVLFIALTVLFQPFIKLPLGRFLWNMVDLIAAAILVYYLISHVNK